MKTVNLTNTELLSINGGCIFGNIYKTFQIPIHRAWNWIVENAS